MTDLAPLQSPMLAKLPGVRHAFFTRRGGVSTGIYDSLNVGFGSGDEEASVRENRTRAAGWFGAGFEVYGQVRLGRAAVAQGEERALDAEIEDGGDGEAGEGEEDGCVPVVGIHDAGEVTGVECADLFVGEVEAVGECGEQCGAGDADLAYGGAAFGRSSGDAGEADGEDRETDDGAGCGNAGD